ncbi:MAG: acyl carrier protein [Lachnospiraceae bacterium]|jgi:acyl carrier protein|nr:acyl carrier protein [Lachnospiraceae bacterium]
MELEMLKKIVSEILGVDIREIKPESSFVDDLGADSLDLLQIVMGMEEKFNVKIPEEDLTGIVTVQDAIDRIEVLTNSR